MRKAIARIARESGARRVAAAFYDYHTRTAWSYHGDQWFHAASTIKVAVLLALFDAVAQGRFPLQARLHVRNRFLSVADGGPYRIASGRDANSAVHARVGRMMKIQELALHMIATSSNLATNLLLDLVGLEAAQQTLERLSLRGVELRRGVEDTRAFEAGISNRITANGLLQLFRVIEEEHAFSPAAARQMREILFQQAFRRGLPAGLPEAVRNEARIAHKTGEISTVAHDAGLVYLPGRAPYAVAILTEWAPDDDGSQKGRHETIARISGALYHHLTDEEEA